MALLSPPATPRYNGSAEAGIGSVKHRAELAAARAGRSDCWTHDDLEWARLDANARGRPRGLHGSTPDAAWANRKPITDQERRAFRVRHQVERAQGYAEAGACRTLPLGAQRRAAIERRAVERTLTGLELLQIRRRWVSPPVSQPRTRKIPQ